MRKRQIGLALYGFDCCARMMMIVSLRGSKVLYHSQEARERQS